MRLRLKPGLKPGLNWFQLIGIKRLIALVETVVETQLSVSPSLVPILLARRGLVAR